MSYICTRMLSSLMYAIAIIAMWSVAGYAGDKFIPVEYGKVKVGGEIGRRIDITIENNLLAVDIENDFLKPFREKKNPGGYIGLGKTIDAAARFAVYSNDTRVLSLKNHIVDEVISSQESDGYSGIMLPEKRMWSLWDTHEMSYLVYGLVNDYRHFRNARSLEAARKTADYIIRQWSSMPAKWPGGLHLLFPNTGMDRAFLALGELTGDDRYLKFLNEQLGLTDWNLGIVVGRHGTVEGHAYVYMARCMAQMELFRRTADVSLLRPTRRAIDFLTKGDGLLITGACSYQECWHDNQQGFYKLGETCATAYLIRLLDSMLRLEGNSLYGDIMERTIYNALFAAQSPDGRRLRYYAPFDGERIYFDRDTYCCPCNFRRIIAELPQMIYYTSDGGAVVNLYAPSSAELELGAGLRLELQQETDYPNSGKVVIRINPSREAAFPLKLRIPRWCNNASAVLNGDEMKISARGRGFLTIDRVWKPGDRIELEMPMAWRFVKGRKTQEGRAAVMRGPVLFCLNPERNPDIKEADMRLVRVDPLLPQEGPVNDTAVRAGGMACRIKGIGPANYGSKPDMELILTEFPDPDGKAAYFLVPDPTSDELMDDELIQ